jgi:hypothetical protein
MPPGDLLPVAAASPKAAAPQSPLRTSRKHSCSAVSQGGLGRGNVSSDRLLQIRIPEKRQAGSDGGDWLFEARGIRMALGAAPPDVLRHVLVGGLLPVFVGLLVGGLASIAASQLVAGLVVGATGVSASVMVMAAAVLTIIAAMAASLPARRATMIDPLAALRME